MKIATGGRGPRGMCAGAGERVDIGAAEGRMGCESGATLGTDLDNLLTFEHLGHHVPQFLQVAQDGAVS